MAKSGQIQLPTGVAPGTFPLADSVVFTESTPTNMGGVVQDLLTSSEDGLKVIVDLPNRQVYAYPEATDAAAALTGGTAKLIGTITRDDATKRSSAVTRAAGDDISADPDLTAFAAELDAQFGPAGKPAKNIASIVNLMEDTAAKLAAQNPAVDVGNIFVLVDQTGDGTVQVYAKGGINAPAGALAIVKQVPTTTTTGPAPLAFE